MMKCESGRERNERRRSRRDVCVGTDELRSDERLAVVRDRHDRRWIAEGKDTVEWKATGKKYI